MSGSRQYKNGKLILKHENPQILNGGANHFHDRGWRSDTGIKMDGAQCSIVMRRSTRAERAWDKENSPEAFRKKEWEFAHKLEQMARELEAKQKAEDREKLIEDIANAVVAKLKDIRLVDWSGGYIYYRIVDDYIVTMTSPPPSEDCYLTKDEAEAELRRRLGEENE